MSAPQQQSTRELWAALGHAGTPDVRDPLLWPGLLDEVRLLFRIGTTVAGQLGVPVSNVAPEHAVPDGPTECGGCESPLCPTHGRLR